MPGLSPFRAQHCGSGDSMAAALAVAEEAGMALADTIRLSMAAGAASVMESGSRPQLMTQ